MIFTGMIVGAIVGGIIQYLMRDDESDYNY